MIRASPDAPPTQPPRNAGTAPAVGPSEAGHPARGRRAGRPAWPAPATCGYALTSSHVPPASTVEAMARSKQQDKERYRNLAVNRRARRDYEIAETFEAGISLLGTEVKSCREGRIQLKDSYARLKDGEVWLYDCHISPYTHASHANHDPERPRKLLLKAYQIQRLLGKTERSGFTLIPLRFYVKGSWIKVEIALARGRAKHEKRDALKKKIQEREIQQALRARR